MEVILCLDDRNGMLFNGRRQSRDRQVIGDILKTAGDRPLWIRPFSLPLFAGAEERVTVDPEPLARGGLCFVEDLPRKPWEGKIEKLTVYRWNKLYPGDFYLDLECIGIVHAIHNNQVVGLEFRQFQNYGFYLRWENIYATNNQHIVTST